MPRPIIVTETDNELSSGFILDIGHTCTAAAFGGASLPEDPVHGGVVFERGQGHSRALLVIPMAPSPPGGTTEGSEGACEALLLPTLVAVNGFAGPCHGGGELSGVPSFASQTFLKNTRSTR